MGRKALYVVLALVWGMAFIGCTKDDGDGGSTDADSDGDTDTDGDSDVDTDTDVDTDADTDADSDSDADGDTDSGCGVEMTPGGFGVLGTDVLNEECQPVMFHGVNCPSLEWWATGMRLHPNTFAEVASWGGNLIRLPLNQAFWLPWGDNDHTGYQAIVAEVVGWARDAGLNIILDLHRAPLQGNEVNERQVMTNLDSLVFWEEVATRFKDEPHVLFELYNEPREVEWSVWRDGGTHADGWTIVGLQELYDTVRATGAHNLVLVGGLGWAYNLDGLVDYPMTGYNIAYVTHLYDYGNKQPATWQEDWLFMADSAPVFITEFGPGPDDGVSVNQYVQDVLAAADANGLHWTSWAMYHFSTNGLVYDTWDPESNQFDLTPIGEHIKAKLQTFL